jgi:hypothetical protein
MIDLNHLARRYGLRQADTGALLVGGCRIAPWSADDRLLCVTTDDEDSARTIARTGFCRVEYRAGYGRLTATFNARRIGELIEALSPEDEMPSYGRFRS